MDLGLERAGIRTVLQVEIDPWCRAVLERHFPGVERVNDVREVDAQSWRGRCRDVERDGAQPDAQRLEGTARGAAYVDLVHGGFPCQDVSVAGRRAGLAGERSGLFFEFIRVVRELRPAIALIENVPGLLSSHGGRDFAVVLRELANLGALDIAWAILDARWFGVAQRRRRLFVVADFRGECAAEILFEPAGGGGDPAAGGAAGEDLAYSLAASARGTDDGHGNAWNTTCVARSLTARNERIDGETENFIVANAVRASDGHHGHPNSNEPGRHHEDDENLVVGQGVRRLTPLECERLMGWPDEWTRWTAGGREVADSARYRMCGNGVVTSVAEWIGRRLRAVHEANP